MRTTDQRTEEQRRADTDALAAAWTSAVAALETETGQRPPLAPWIALRELEARAANGAERLEEAHSEDESAEEVERLAIAAFRAALEHASLALVALALAARRRNAKSLTPVVPLVRH